MKISRKPFLTLLAMACVPMVTVFWINASNNDTYYQKIYQNLDLFGEIYKSVATEYVDQVDPEKFMRAGIQGMLGTLDPYSDYIENEDRQQLQILTDGKYDGVGMLLNYRNNMVTVAEPPFIGTPAARAGIREGDQILQINGEDTKVLGFEETVRRVRGPAGSEVTITIIREGESKTLEFTLIREHIKVEDIRYAGFIDEGIGYILLTRFSKYAGQEVYDDIQNLKKSGMKGLILDLRSNPGGLLPAAVAVSDLFVLKNKVIVSTKGRGKNTNQEFRAFRDPVVTDLPLIILVNRFSASASEIVAGAIQDNDIGIVVGDTTFGKGLVQTVLRLSPTSALKLTTAKYYTPSGRCIQKTSYSDWSDSLLMDKTLAYKTSAGRDVYGGGGVAPDIYIKPERASDYVVDLQRKSLFFNFAVHYANTHTTQDSSMVVTDDILGQFSSYIKEKNYSYKHPIESNLNVLKMEAVDGQYGVDFLQNVDRLEKSLNSKKEEMFSGNRDQIRKLLRRELASKFFGLTRGTEISLMDDPAVQKSINIIKDPELYRSVLSLKQ